jgi:RHS repeat-associated protein
VEWRIDSAGRRIQQREYSWNLAITNYNLIANIKCLYSGWQCLSELEAISNTLLRAYVWGLDLSGSQTGAGGVGGLLWLYSAANGTHFYAYDGNGNFAALVAASNGDETARYEYCPFGQTLCATGPMAEVNPFGFSTKRTVRSTGIILYEYRPYLSWLGRWLSLDFSEEYGGLNLHGFLNNGSSGISGGLFAG